jgi:hypothetical protein
VARGRRVGVPVILLHRILAVLARRAGRGGSALPAFGRRIEALERGGHPWKRAGPHDDPGQARGGAAFSRRWASWRAAFPDDEPHSRLEEEVADAWHPLPRSLRGLCLLPRSLRGFFLLAEPPTPPVVSLRRLRSLKKPPEGGGEGLDGVEG